MNISKQITQAKKAVIAIGFRPTPNQITIIGSGFAVSKDGQILSSAHLYNQLKPEQIENLMGMTMIEEGEQDLERYTWLPLKLLEKDDQTDLALFQLEAYEKTLLCPLELGDSEKAEVGQNVYFVGFPYAAQLINDGFGITLIANKGIISNVKRDGADSERKRNWFIVDAISNPGNSGCPLIDTESNRVIGVMTISFRTKSKIKTFEELDIREPMHIAGAKPINLAKKLLDKK